MPIIIKVNDIITEFKEEIKELLPLRDMEIGYSYNVQNLKFDINIEVSFVLDLSNYDKNAYIKTINKFYVEIIEDKNFLFIYEKQFDELITKLSQDSVAHTRAIFYDRTRTYDSPFKFVAIPYYDFKQIMDKVIKKS